MYIMLQVFGILVKTTIINRNRGSLGICPQASYPLKGGTNYKLQWLGRFNFKLYSSKNL